jgi:hypothetical protein
VKTILIVIRFGKVLNFRLIIIIIRILIIFVTFDKLSQTFKGLFRLHPDRNYKR